jgi:hypothetical protein
MPIVIDPATRRLILDSTNVTAQAIYVAWADWVLLSDNSKYLPAFSSAGGESLGAGLSIPPYYFLENDWRIRPMEANQNLIITGNIFAQGGGIPVVSTLGVFQVNVNYTVSVQAQGISTSGSSGPSAAETAAAVWSASNRTLTSGGSASSLTPSQATMLLEMYELLGLDPSKPLIVTETTRSAGAISQNIATSPSETVVSRV